MKNQSQSGRMSKRKSLLILPLVVIPFATLIFISLGGGKAEKTAIDAAAKTGFNLKLPDALLKEDKTEGKLAYYDKAALDSAKFQEMIKNDPNYRQGEFPEDAAFPGYNGNPYSSPPAGLNTSLYGRGNYNDPNGDRILQRLAELDREMNRPAESYGNGDYGYQGNIGQSKADVDRLEKMMQMMGNNSESADPEMQQLNGMLENILDIQNPNRVQEKLRQSSEARRGQVFAVFSNAKADSTTLLDTSNSDNIESNGFYALNTSIANGEIQNSIQAVIHETQEIVSGSIVKLRILNDIFINGVRIPKDNFVFGTASLTGERLAIKINSIRFKNSLFPVELSVYDLDGLDGLYIPGAIARDVAKESTDRSMQNIGIGSLDPSWGAQAASAGIEAAKSFLSKKTKLIRVTAKAGYRVLLRDEKQKQDQQN